MVKDAAAHETEDKEARETVEKRNRLDGLILEIEKTLSENKDKLPQQDVESLQNALEKAKVALKEHENDAEQLQKATDELLAASHKVAELMYKNVNQEQSAENKSESEEEPLEGEIKE